MFQQGSYLKVIDNSQAKEVTCVKVLKNGFRPQGQVGDLLLVSVQSLRRSKGVSSTKKGPSAKRGLKELKKGDLVKALPVRSRRNMDRSRGLGRKAKTQTGIQISFPKENAALLLNANGQDPLATRVRGPLSPTVRTKAFTKVLSLGGSLA